jgi:hypothetical protein
MSWTFYFAPPSSFFDFASDAWLHVAHHVVELFLFNTWRTEICAPAADCILRLIECASQLAGRAYVDTTAADPANVGFYIEGRSDTAFLASPPEADGIRRHLFLAHTHTPPAHNTVLVLLPEALLADLIG